MYLLMLFMYLISERMGIYEYEERYPVVYFDIETTQLEKGGVADIIQLGAYMNDIINFEAYCLPIRNIGNAARINGFQIKNGNLYQHGGLVEEAESILDILHRFVEWLERFNKPVILVAHNCFQFDAKVLFVLIFNFIFFFLGGEGGDLNT